MILCSLVAAQVIAKPTFPLTVASIMRGPALIGGAPRNLRWSADGAKLYFSWAKADGTQNPRYDDFSVDRNGYGLAKSTGKLPIDLIPDAAEINGNRSLYSQGGELYLFDRTKSTPLRLSRTRQGAGNPIFIEGGRAIAYEQGTDLFRMDLSTGETVQIAQAVETADSPKPIEPSPSESALHTEESKLFKYSGGGFGEAGRGFRGRRRQGGGNSEVTSISIPKGSSFGGYTVSPSGTWVAVRFFQGSPGRQTIVPNYVTRSGYTEDIPSYEKVGDVHQSQMLAVVDLTSGDKYELKLPREGSAERMAWSPDGSNLAVWAGSRDHKDRWLEDFDIAAKSFSQVFDEHNEAWVGGPGGGSLGWLPDGNRLWFESEKTGFAQLYTMDPKGKDLSVVTSGEFEVSDVRIDRARNRFTFISDEGSPARRHLDWVAFSGGPREKMADLSADEESTYAIAPDGMTVAEVRSSANRPPELYLGTYQVTHTPTSEWLAGPWKSPPIVEVTARDGVKVPGHLYLPERPKPGGPAVIFVHGAGYLQNVYDGWSYYYREYMFHHLLAQMGYTVLDLDYRGSAGYGASWRTAIYRHMGGKDLEDQVDGARWLVEKYGVNPHRIGIYGGSYGGFITLMAMFTTPDVFACGAALRPVSDWANYNDGYTSEILNFPQDDPESYRKSSPIYFAEGLKGSLLICHGMVDTNVHFQDSVRLCERLIELGKRNWQLAPYPVEDHSFVHPESWTDEYRRILDLFERTIGSHRKVQ